MTGLIETLEYRFSADPSVCVTGALLVYHKKGNKRARVAPDVFVVPGVGNHTRDNYLLWEEGRGLDCVIEVTSRRTRFRDTVWKRNLYLTKLGVQEYFLFDPRQDYLTPSLQGFRRLADEFHPIPAVEGRLPSKVLGLHLGRDGEQLRFHDPATGGRVPTRLEAAEARAEAARAQAEAARASPDLERAQADAARAQADAARAEIYGHQMRRLQAESESIRLRAELEQLRRRLYLQTAVTALHQSPGPT